MKQSKTVTFEISIPEESHVQLLRLIRKGFYDDMDILFSSAFTLLIEGCKSLEEGAVLAVVTPGIAQATTVVFCNYEKPFQKRQSPQIAEKKPFLRVVK